jgi:hypothetical protein
MKDTDPAELEYRGIDWPQEGDSVRVPSAPDADVLQQQLKALAAQVEILQDCVAQILRTRPDDGRVPSEYDWYVKRFQRWLAETLPPDARVLVASRGDQALLAIPGRDAGHFPQDDKDQYAGFYPSDDTAAIGHLEALRGQGYDTLVFPDSAKWWLDHYAGLRRHLETRYVEIGSGLVCRVFDLRDRAERRPLDEGRLDEVLGQARRRLGRDPDVLDWATGANLRRRFPDLAVAESGGELLPHFDSSIDIVAIAEGTPIAMREARRVATAAIVVVSEGRAVRIEWLQASRPGVAAGEVTMMEVPEPLESGPVRSRRIHVDDGPAEDVLVWTSAGVTPCPGAVASLVATLQRFPQAGAVGARILDFAGRLYHAGGFMAPDAALRSRGEGSWHPDDPRYSSVQAVDYCSTLFLATTRRAFDAAGGFDTDMPHDALRDADFGLRVQEAGYAIYYQPESVAVCSAALTRLLRAPGAGADLAGRRQEFGERWKAVLQARVPRGDGWGI